MPAHQARKPIQLTDVPVKRKVARAPADRLNDAVPPLQSRLRLPWNHGDGCLGADDEPGVYVMAGSVSSNRVAGEGGGGAVVATIAGMGADVMLVCPAASGTLASQHDPELQSTSRTRARGLRCVLSLPVTAVAAG